MSASHMRKLTTPHILTQFHSNSR